MNKVTLTDYLRSLIAAADLSQRSAARWLCIDEGNFRAYCRGSLRVPLYVFYAMERLVHLRTGRDPSSFIPPPTDRRQVPEEKART